MSSPEDLKLEITVETLLSIGYSRSRILQHLEQKGQPIDVCKFQSIRARIARKQCPKIKSDKEPRKRGRRSVVGQDMIEKIAAAIQEEKPPSQRKLAEEFNCSVATLNRIINEDLKDIVYKERRGPQSFKARHSNSHVPRRRTVRTQETINKIAIALQSKNAPSQRKLARQFNCSIASLNRIIHEDLKDIAYTPKIEEPSSSDVPCYLQVSERRSVRTQEMINKMANALRSEDRPSQRKLASMFNCSVATANRIINEDLKDAGIPYRSRQHFSTASENHEHLGRRPIRTKAMIDQIAELIQVERRPSQRTLAKKFNCSVATLNRIINEDLKHLKK